LLLLIKYHTDCTLPDSRHGRRVPPANVQYR